MSFLKRTFWAFSQLVTTPSHSTRLSSVFLLLVVLTGWIGAPLVHEIEHALERADLAHVHDEHDGVTLRTGCDVLPEIAEECPISLTNVPAVGSLGTPAIVPDADRSPWVAYESVQLSRPASFKFVRGPPVLI
jgi:hypothetical protein